MNGQSSRETVTHKYDKIKKKIKELFCFNVYAKMETKYLIK